jgi:hypothetical protein
MDKHSIYLSTEHVNGWYTKIKAAPHGTDWGDGVNRWFIEPVEGLLGPKNEPMYRIRTGGYGLWLSTHAGAGKAWYIKGAS